MLDILPWSDKSHSDRDLFAPRAMAKVDFQYFLLPVPIFCATIIYLAGLLESLTGTLNEHSSCLNSADLLTVTGSADITSVLSPVKCLRSWTPPLSQNLVNPGEEQPSTCSAWLMPLMPGDCCYVRHPVKCLFLTVSLSCLWSYLDLVWGVEWGGGGGQEWSRAKDLLFLLKIGILGE